jgi:hypothetical protein
MIIGISGKARTGKDTFAEFLAGAMNKGAYPPYIMMAFANELKLKCQEAFDLTWEQLWGDDKEKYDERYPKSRGALPFCVGNRDDGKGLEVLEERKHWTAREIMQDFGAFYRTIDNEFWVKNLFRVAEDKEYSNAIITDVRYINEADFIVDNGGYVIRVDRENKDTVHNEQHPSEVELDGYSRFDYHVINNWSLVELKEAAGDVARFLADSEKDLKNLKEIKING